MKIGIRAALQALLEADDQIGGKTLGESALTLVRRHRTQTESARTMQVGIERLKAELNEAHQSEARALAERDKVWAQFRGLGFEFDDLLKERDALAAARDALEHQLAEVTGQRDHYQSSTRNLSEQQDTLVRERDAAIARTSKVEAQLATVIAQYNATTITLSDARAKWEADERTYLRDCTDIAKQRDEALHNLGLARMDRDRLSALIQGKRAGL